MRSLLERLWQTILGIWGTAKRWGQTTRRIWRTGKTGVALFLVTVVVAAYTYIVVSSQEVQTWKQDIQDISTFIPVAGVIVGALIGDIDFIMLLSDWYSEKKQKEIKEAEAVGLAMGAAKFYAEVKNWNDRRIDAIRKGEEFDEPMPTPQNVQESTPVEQTTEDYAVDDTVVK